MDHEEIVQHGHHVCYSDTILFKIKNFKDFLQTSAEEKEVSLKMPVSTELLLTLATFKITNSKSSSHLSIHGEAKIELEEKDRCLSSFSIIDKKNEVFASCNHVSELLPNQSNNEKLKITFDNFVSKLAILENAERLLIEPKQILRLVLEVKYIKPVYNSIAKPIRENPEKNQDFEMLLETEKFSDIELITADGKTLKAHMAILAARSPVFLRMFEHDMMEKKEKKVEIKDIEYTLMKELLEFIYTGRIQNLKDSARELLVVSDKYDIKSLQIKCEEMLKENINVDQAIQTLVLAHTHNAENLKSVATDFVIDNVKDIISTADFMNLKTSNAELLEDIFCKLALRD